MRNIYIWRMGEMGIEAVSSHSLPAEHAYKVVKLKGAIVKAFEELDAKRQELLRECGIEQGKKPSAEALVRFDGLWRELLADDTPLHGIKSLPFDVWRQLQEENKEKGKDGIDLLGGAAELYLEGVFWMPPSEKEVKESKTASKKSN